MTQAALTAPVELDPRFNPLMALDEHIDSPEDDKKLFVRFSVRPVMNPIKSTEAGRPVFDELDYIEIRVPGSQLSAVIAPYSDYKGRFVAQYNQWKAQQKDVLSGTPLESFPYLLGKPGMVAELKAMHVHTVEQLANLADGWIQQVMGGNELRSRAKLWLDETTGTDAQLAQMTKRADDSEALVRQMQKQMADMQTQMAEMQAQGQAPKARTAVKAEGK